MICNMDSKNVDLNMNVSIYETRKVSHHGENIRHYRTRIGFSQLCLAKLCNLEQYQISRLESQEFVDEKYLKIIADALNLGINWLKDIPAPIPNHTFKIDGKNNFYQNTGKVISNYTLQAPIDETRHIQNLFIEKLKECYQSIISKKDEKIEKLEKLLATERTARESLWKENIELQSKP